MNSRPDGPSPALLAAQRRLEEAKRRYQQKAGGGRWSVASGQWPVVGDQPAAIAARPSLPETSLQPSSFSVHPSLAVAMLGQGVAAAGRIWLLLRYLDREGRGWLALDQAQQQLCDKESAMRVCGRRQLRNLLRQGEGVFWQRDKSRIWLRSAARVAVVLGVERLRGRPVAVPLDALLGGMGQVRAHFYATFHSGRPGQKGDKPGNPISRSTLQKISHVPARTQRLYEQRTGVKVRANIAVGERLTDKNLQERAWRHGRATFSFTDSEGRQGPAGGRYVAWRLPNSYSGPHALSPQGRMKKINHQIDLVNSRVQGNDLYRTSTCRQVDVRSSVDRLFHSNGREAGRAYNRDQSQDIYWPAGRGSAGGRRLWRVLPAKGGRK